VLKGAEFAGVDVEADEPQALISAAQASAVSAMMAPRRARTRKAILGVGGSMCMRAY
jgi:hypothetical protein